MQIVWHEGCILSLHTQHTEQQLRAYGVNGAEPTGGLWGGGGRKEKYIHSSN